MKIPQWMYERQDGVWHAERTIKHVAQMLRIEAQMYRQAGRRKEARAIRQVAARLTDLSNKGWSPAVGFDWPKKEVKQ